MDGRFARMFKDQQFVETPKVDARGQPLRRDAGKQKLQEFYELAGVEGAEAMASSAQDEDVAENEAEDELDLEGLEEEDLDESEEEDWMTYVDLMDLDGIDLLDWGFYISKPIHQIYSWFLILFCSPVVGSANFSYLFLQWFLFL